MSPSKIACWVFVLAGDLVAPTIASTLIREGRLVEKSRDTSDLTFGGLSPQNSAGNGCSWNTYYESCAGNGGTVIYKNEYNGPSFNLNGNTVTSCSRYRRVSSCTQSGTSIASTNYGGSKVTYEIVSDSNVIAQLPISRELADSCNGVCTDGGALAFPSDSRANCEVGSGWASVNDDFEEACASPAVCADLDVLKGCESTQKDIIGKYTPVSDLSGCSSSDVDKSRSVYFSSAAGKYLFYHTTKNEWIFNTFCSDLAPVSAFLEAGEEPFLDTDTSVECYDGGSGSSKRYTFTDVMIQCNKMSTSGGSSETAGSETARLAEEKGFGHVWAANEGWVVGSSFSGTGNLPYKNVPGTDSLEECLEACAGIDATSGFFSDAAGDGDGNDCICDLATDCREPDPGSYDPGSTSVVFSTVPMPAVCDRTFCEFFPTDGFCTGTDGKGRDPGTTSRGGSSAGSPVAAFSKALPLLLALTAGIVAV